MPEGLKIIVGADITDAQAKLKKVVVDAKVAGKEVEKSFGGARLPLGDIKAYTASIQNLKQNLSGVTFAPLTQGIAGSGEAAAGTAPKITGLLSSLGRGGMVAIVGLAVGALTQLITSLLDTDQPLKDITANFDRIKSSIEAVNDSLSTLGDDLDFIKKFKRQIAEIQGIKGTALEIIDLTQQKRNDEILKGQLESDLKDIENQIKKSLANIKVLAKSQDIDLEFNQQGLISDSILTDAGKVTKKYFEIFNTLVKQKDSLNKKLIKINQDAALTDNGITIQGNKQQEESNKQRIEDYKKFLDALRKQIEFEEALRQLQADILKRHFKESGVLNTAGTREAVTVDINLSTLSTNFPELGQKISSDLKKAIEDGMKNNPILLEGDRRKKQGEDELLKIEDDAKRAAQAINGLLTPAFDGLFDAIKAGENPLKAFFEGLGQAVLQLIQKLIQAAITAAILSAILPGGGGGFSALFGKFLGLAGGGLVSGPTLAAVGEGSGTSLSNPEVVAPLDQLKAMLGDIGTGGTQVVVMRTQISGNNLALVQARTSRRNQRLGATG